MKSEYNEGGLHFFDDRIVIPGISNLDDASSRSCNLKIGSNGNVNHGISYGVHFRIGILEEGVCTTSMPRNEMGLGLALGEARVFCKALYNLAKQNSPAKDSVEIAFSGDNSAKEFQSRTSYVKRSQAGESRLALTLKVEPAISKEGVAQITLEAQAKDNVYFCSANLSAQDALILSYILRCSFMDTFDAYSRDLLFSSYDSS
jgi:hypothetical protein